MPTFISGSTGISGTDGTAATPAVQGATANTGVFFPAANTVAVATAGAERMRITSGGDLQFNSGYGSVAVAYGCRAWVNFNGTGTVAIRGSGNVSSITDNNVGDYTINFTTALPDANYSCVGSAQETVAVGSVNRFFSVDTVATTGARVFVSYTGTSFDPEGVHVAIFR